jgi:hypothetical protein
MTNERPISPVNPENLRSLAAERIKTAVHAFRRDDSNREAAARLSQALDVRRRRAVLNQRLVPDATATNRQRPFELFLSQSFNELYRDKVRAAVDAEAAMFNMNIVTGDEIFGRGRSARDIVRKINLRILDCDCFLCVVTPIPEDDDELKKRAWFGKRPEAKKRDSRLGSWFAFEAALAYAYDKPLVIMSHENTFLATKPIFGWTEVRTFPDLDFDSTRFRQELRTALDTLNREFLEQLRTEIPR